MRSIDIDPVRMSNAVHNRGGLEYQAFAGRRHNSAPLILPGTAMHPYQHSVMTPAAHDCRILKSIDDVVAIRAEWDRLWVDARAGYSLSFSYVCDSWNTIHRPQGAELCCVVLFQNDRLLAALPIVLLRGKLKLWKCAVICSPEAAEGCDILIERATDSQAIATALLKKFLISVRPDVVNFFFVKSGCHLDIAIQSLASLRIVEAYDNVMPYADLKAEVDWASYKRSLSKHYESNVARKTRRLHEQGEVTM
jgi:CelD/BcsL family acetyltransferase involved in cellulose biosynthesis